jgi:hypothetical protein
MINKDEKAARKVTVKINGYGAGELVRLLAPSYQARTGITLGGLTFDGSLDGKPRGSLKGETIIPDKGVYNLQLPPTNAAILVLKHS